MTATFLNLSFIQVGNEYVNKGQNKDQVINSIGALSKSVREDLLAPVESIGRISLSRSTTECSVAWSNVSTRLWTLKPNVNTLSVCSISPVSKSSM